MKHNYASLADKKVLKMNIKIALCQLNIIWEDKKRNIEKAKHYIEEAAFNGCKMILFPEMSFTGFSPNILKTKENDLYTLKQIANLAKKNKIAVGFGWVKENAEEHSKAENHYSIVNDMGETISDYVKIHSFEYGGEGKQFVSGNELSIFNFGGLCFAQFICYDLRFPEIFQIASKKADVLLVPANWPAKRASHWKNLLQARAIENQSYVLGINCVGEIGGLKYSGDSCAINPSGEVVKSINGKEGLIYTNLSIGETKIREIFPVKKDRKEELYKRLMGK